MDFALTEEQEFFQKTIAGIVDKMVVPRAEEMDRTDEFPWQLWKDFSKLGYLGLRYPESVGGLNADKIMCMLFFEEIARGSAGFSQTVNQNALMGTHFVYRFGSDAIKERCFYPAIRGEKITTICFTEDQSGSDLAGTRTTAKRDGEGWRINGVKQWITNGPICDFCTVLATTDPSAGLKGLRLGDAEVSPEHANFLVNHGRATAQEFADLMDQVRSRVLEVHGVTLEPEVEIWRE